MDYLDRHERDLDKMTESEIIIELMHIDWGEIKRLAKARFRAGHDEFGTTLWQKTPAEINTEEKQELADWLNYLWAKKNSP